LTSILRFKLTEFQKIYPRLVVIPDIYTKDVPPKDAHQLAGADFLLNGEVYSFELDVQVSFHLINAETRQEVYSDRIVTASLGQVDLQMALLRKDPGIHQAHASHGKCWQGLSPAGCPSPEVKAEMDVVGRDVVCRTNRKENNLAYGKLQAFHKSGGKATLSLTKMSKLQSSGASWQKVKCGTLPLLHSL
jgi:hypothetical protein